VHIAAYMAALDVWDVSPAAKHALQVICGRADRYTGMARVSIPRVATDMGRTYNTALKALDELLETGYLTVDKSPGQANLWMLTTRLTPATTAGVPLQSTHPTPATTAGDPCNLYRGKESLEKSKEAPPPRSLQAASGGTGENLGDPPRHIAFAPGSGNLPDFTGIGHHPATTGRRLPDFLEQHTARRVPLTPEDLAARAAAREKRHLDQQAAMYATGAEDADVIDLAARRGPEPDEEP